MTRRFTQLSGAVRILASLAVVSGVIALSGRGSEAHKPITSKYTYNDDVFPIVREKCSRCHVAGGVAPIVATVFVRYFPGEYWPLAMYIILMSLVSLACVWRLAETSRKDIT